jgi:hypothetical protein
LRGFGSPKVDDKEAQTRPHKGWEEGKEEEDMTRINGLIMQLGLGIKPHQNNLLISPKCLSFSPQASVWHRGVGYR